MGLVETLRPECIKAGEHAENKREVLRKIAELAKQSDVLEGISEEDIFQALEAREKLGTTGFARGAAIPHCSFEGIASFVVGLMTIPEGVDFASLDGEASRIFFFIIGPKDQRNEHVHLLSMISKIIKTPGAIEKILREDHADSLREVVLSYVPRRQQEEVVREKCFFHVFVQKEEVFDDILEIFSAAVQASITVIEANNAGYYLHRLPLFSAYWSDTDRSFSRIIVAVVDKSACNDTIRRINMITDTTEESGVLITVQDIFYASGSMEF